FEGVVAVRLCEFESHLGHLEKSATDRLTIIADFLFYPAPPSTLPHSLPTPPHCISLSDFGCLFTHTFIVFVAILPLLL
ncbi:hypothetical protein, partial [Duncaniella muris]|uniref:hypothetical protein n=1 Tax=Duncaniella muris TaxID=2094150 RepID=UPI002676DA4E